MSEPDPSIISQEFLQLADTLATYSVETLREYHAAHSAHLAMPAPGQLRRQRLGTILSFIGVHGRPPTASEYDQHHTHRLGLGLDSMPRSTVEEHYGTFAEAIDAAARLFQRGSAGRVASRQPRPAIRWTDQKCYATMQACRAQLGHWPGDREFAALRRAGEKLCAANGWTGLVLPDAKVVTNLFGSYGEMRLRAQQHFVALAEHQASLTSQSEARRSATGRTKRRRLRSKNITLRP